MKLRVTGTEEETITFVNQLDEYFNLISVSMFYPNNRKCLLSKEGRIYIEISNNHKKIKNTGEK